MMEWENQEEDIILEEQDEVDQEVQNVVAVLEVAWVVQMVSQFFFNSLKVSFESIENTRKVSENLKF